MDPQRIWVLSRGHNFAITSLVLRFFFRISYLSSSQAFLIPSSYAFSLIFPRFWIWSLIVLFQPTLGAEICLLYLYFLLDLLYLYRSSLVFQYFIRFSIFFYHISSLRFFSYLPHQNSLLALSFSFHLVPNIYHPVIYRIISRRLIFLLLLIHNKLRVWLNTHIHLNIN